MAFIIGEKLAKQYGTVRALDHVDLSIERGEWVSIMGPSGSGKTTVLNLLGCLDTPDEGQLLIDGQDVTRLSNAQLTEFRREHIGLIFQQFHLIPYLTALENVMLAQYYHSLVDEAEAIEALKRVGLADRLHHLPSELSGGEQQRVCIARALINEPSLLLADEPTGNLDEENERIVMDLFTRLHQDGHTLVLVTHDVQIGRQAERQIQLEHGRIVGFDLTPAKVEENIDEIMEQLWMLKETDQLTLDAFVKAHGRLGEAYIKSGRMGQLFALRGNEIILTEEGDMRARTLIRRHRLAETLFSNTLSMTDQQAEVEACVFEHILSPEMTNSICAFLGHPRMCPHGKMIPPGPCCVQVASSQQTAASSQ
ncbi:MAG: ATP-binding cassette domain-containing protein [Acidobacteria bacterium]|nr:ATP-binding cassette domain-containing protein [Acidobacteriota bacterium]